MKIIKPSVTEYLQSNNLKEHITRVAKVCYATEKIKDVDKFTQHLIDRKHWSMLRHVTIYFNLNYGDLIYDKDVRDLRLSLLNNPYSKIIEGEEACYIITNMQVIYDKSLKYMLEYHDCNFATNIDKLNEPDNIKNILKENIRHTFEVVTQISTSRELNRTSPNAIAEQSTRYCNFSKDKFNNEITICCPHWIDFERTETYLDNLNINYKDEMHKITVIDYLLSCNNAEQVYFNLLSKGIKPEDARGVLPLDTATKVVYTYSFKEWKHIINLRYYGTTGKPHSNAKIITGMIREKLINIGYKFDEIEKQQ